jgi:hypothetical protein
MKEQGWEAMMAARLRLLAAADEQDQAPARVEAALRAAYRRRYGTRRGSWPWVVAWGAVAASVLAFVAFTAPARRRPEEPRPAIENTPPPPARLEASPVPGMPRRGPRAKRYNAAAPVPAGREVATEFIPLVYGDTLGAEETHQVVRVRLSRAALVSFGVPVNEEQAGGRVQADVVLGGDGMARAIRFVREVSARE